MALSEYTLAHIPPSLLASAALSLSLMIQEPGASLTSVWSPTLQFYSTYRPEDLLPVLPRLAAVITRRGGTELRAVHTKYSRRKFLKVAKMVELDGEIVQKLASMELPHRTNLSKPEHLLDNDAPESRRKKILKSSSRDDKEKPRMKKKKKRSASLSSSGEAEEKRRKYSKKVWDDMYRGPGEGRA